METDASKFCWMPKPGATALSEDRAVASDDGRRRKSLADGPWPFNHRFPSPKKLAAFTLIELILVMVLLATLMAIVAPSLSRAFKGRALEQEAARLLAASEYARSEAVSQGLPMNLWIDPLGGTYGICAKDGNPGIPSREKSWALASELRFDLLPAPTDTAGRVIAAAFDPEGTLTPGNITPLILVNRSGERISLQQTGDGWGYEIAPAP